MLSAKRLSGKQPNKSVQRTGHEGFARFHRFVGGPPLTSIVGLQIVVPPLEAFAFRSVEECRICKG